MKRYEFGYDEQAGAGRGLDFTRNAYFDPVRAGELKLTPDDVRFYELVYDAELRWVDDNLMAPLFEGLSKLQVYDNCLIVVTSDHGEELYDHGSVGHGRTLYEELIRIPMVVKFPRGRKPQGLQPQVTGMTRSIDLLPSLVAYFGGEAPAELPGVKLFEGAVAESAYAQTKSDWALVRERWKYVWQPSGESLFDLVADPDERRSLAGGEPDRAAAMRAAGGTLKRDVEISPWSAPVIDTMLDPDAERALRELGYIR